MKETSYSASAGWQYLVIDIALFIAVPLLFASVAIGLGPIGVIFGIMDLIAACLIAGGFFILQPNEARVLLLFGKYIGTVRSEGFFWANPFFTKRRISLRLRNLNSEKLKVNDHSGNPIEIAFVLVWKVEDTYEACFEVDDYINYVMIQSESALRHLASIYPYDSWEDESAISLRGSIDQVSKALESELQERLGKAGVLVMEARLSHLAYAPEIAEAPSSTGFRHHRGPFAHRRRRGRHGAHGARTPFCRKRHRARRRTQGVDG
jgi:hypothetical protein